MNVIEKGSEQCVDAFSEFSLCWKRIWHAFKAQHKCTCIAHQQQTTTMTTPLKRNWEEVPFQTENYDREKKNLKIYWVNASTDKNRQKIPIVLPQKLKTRKQRAQRQHTNMENMLLYTLFYFSAATAAARTLSHTNFHSFQRSFFLFLLLLLLFHRHSILKRHKLNIKLKMGTKCVVIEKIFSLRLSQIFNRV